MTAPCTDARGRDIKPWDRQFPEFSYSASMERRRRECARAHFHHVYTAHRGWDAPPDSPAWLAYRLKSAQPLAMTLGIAVHDAAIRCVRALLAGLALPTVEQLYTDAAASLNARWKNGRDARQSFLRRPKAAPLYLEALYQVGPTPGTLLRAREKLWRVLTNLVACDEIWALVRAADAKEVWLVDPFYRFPLVQPTTGHVVPCYAAPDLLVRPRGQPLHLIDWKSGNADGVIDQVLTYALAARDGLRLEVQDGCIGIVVALDAPTDDRVSSFEISLADIDETALQIWANIDRARSLVADAVTNRPLPQDMFAKTGDTRRCGRCTFRALCHSELYTIATH